MAERRDFDLEATLRDVGASLRYPPTADLLPAVRTRIEAPERGGSLLDLLRSPLQLAPAVATLALLVLATLAFQPVASQAAEALGLRGIGLFPVPSIPAAIASPAAGLIPADARRVRSIDDASREVGFPVLVPNALGPADATYVRRADGSAMAFLFYGERTGVPASGATLLIVQVRGSLETQLLGKGIGPGTRVEEITVGRGRGIWIEGEPHQVFFRAPNGDILVDTIRLAGNVLLWEQGDLLMRIESDISRSDALRIARSMR